jgi:ubiquinone biosynthesis protein
MQVQPSLVLLQKTLLAIEGLGRELYPELDLWQTAKPFLENWMRQRYAPAGIAAKLRRQAPQWLELLPELPELLMENLKQGAALGTVIEHQQQQIRHIENEMKRTRQGRRNLVLASLAGLAALVIASPAALSWLSNLTAVSWLLIAIAALLATRA